MLAENQIRRLCADSEQKVRRLREAIKACESALVAFSGGVDSSFLLKIAYEELAGRVVALTAISPSVAPDEAREAAALAERIGVRHLALSSNELADPRYAENPVNRCYYCKTELFDLCERKRRELGVAWVFDGFNADDRHDHRPGHQAARERAVRSPLAEADLTKDEIRAWSHCLGLPTWDKPQLACLASRIPYGTSVTEQRLLQIGTAEADLKALGLRVFRVRYHGDVARLEVAADELARFDEPAFRTEVNHRLRKRGFKFVALDLEPFRSGRMNESVTETRAVGVALPVLQSDRS